MHHFDALSTTCHHFTLFFHPFQPPYPQHLCGLLQCFSLENMFSSIYSCNNPPATIYSVSLQKRRQYMSILHCFYCKISVKLHNKKATRIPGCFRTFSQYCVYFFCTYTLNLKRITSPSLIPAPTILVPRTRNAHTFFPCMEGTKESGSM